VALLSEQLPYMSKIHTFSEDVNYFLVGRQVAFKNKNVKQSRYRPGVAQRVPGS
jgi:hypothetical protein